MILLVDFQHGQEFLAPLAYFFLLVSGLVSGSFFCGHVGGNEVFAAVVRAWDFVVVSGYTGRFLDSFFLKWGGGSQGRSLGSGSGVGIHDERNLVLFADLSDGGRVSRRVRKRGTLRVGVVRDATVMG